MNMIEKVARAIEPYVVGMNESRIAARAAIEAMKSPSDNLLLAPGEPYQIQKAIHVPREEGIKLRRKAWDQIIDAALKE